MSNNLPENVFPVSYKPVREQGNNKGEVLWYAKGFGWYMSQWNLPYMPQTTHWTYMPEDLNIPSEAEQLRTAAFETWQACVLEHALNHGEADLAKLAFNAGWERART